MGTRTYTQEKVSKLFKNKGWTLLGTYNGCKRPVLCKCSLGHIHTKTLKNLQDGYGCLICYLENNKGSNSNKWAGGVVQNNLALYKTYSKQFFNTQDTKIIIKNGIELLGVYCHNINCNKLFSPTREQAKKRIRAIHGKQLGESNLYCSELCKNNCTTYKQIKWPKGFIPKDSRRDSEVTKQLKEMRLEIDDYKCQVCFSKEKLECHHLDGVALNPVESADVDRCVTICYDCHKDLHKIPGYTLQEYKRKPCKV